MPAVGSGSRSRASFVSVREEYTSFFVLSSSDFIFPDTLVYVSDHHHRILVRVSGCSGKVLIFELFGCSRSHDNLGTLITNHESSAPRLEYGDY